MSFVNLLKKYQMIIISAFAVIVCVVASLLGSLYLTRMENAMWNQLVTDLTEVSYQGAHAFETYIDKERESIGRIADNMTQYRSDDINVSSLLDTYSKGEGIFSLIIFNADGSGEIRVADSEPVKYTKSQMNEAFASYGENGITKPYLNDFTGQRTLGYFKRFVFADGKESIIRKGQLMSYLQDEFSLSFYNDTGFSYITDSDGAIIVRPQHKNSNRTAVNIFDLLSYNGCDEVEISDLKAFMNLNKQGAMRFNAKDEGRVVAFVPLKSAERWYLVSDIPNSAIMSHIEDVLQTSQTLTVIVLLIFVIFVVFLLVTYLYRRKVRTQQTEVRYREQLFGLLANTTDDVYMLMSMRDFFVEYVSPNSFRVLGITPKDLKNAIKAVSEQEYEDDISKSLFSLTDIQSGEQQVFKRNRIHKVTGEIKHFIETVYRTTIGNVDKFIITLSDRTAEIQAESALKDAMESAKAANTAKSVFLSNMSHDIRTPMNAILGFTELIKHDAGNKEKVVEYTNKISTSGQHLLGLINDVLDMSKIENGKFVLNIQKFNLAEFVDEIGMMMRPQANGKNLTFEVCVHDLKQENLLGDKLRINQILINILSNAIKYTPEGGTVKMDISELPKINENFARLRFSVTDNGIGISEEYQKNLFKPFTREISSTVNAIQGTGLGMAITKNLVDLMSGTISVKSRQGEGSTFTVELELRIDDEDINNEFWQETGIKRTLIVDDDIDICKNIVSSLNEAGLYAEYALSGREAIEKVRLCRESGNDYDLIMIDYMMPEMDGIETAERIRQNIGKDVSVLMLTAYDWNDIESEARGKGIDAFLPKPFFISNLKLNVRSLKKSKDAPDSDVPKKVLEGKRFLAAEDNELNSEILVELLDMYGSTCDVAENGKLALEAFEKSEPGYYDGILMDIQMPVMNGYDAAKAVRSSSHPDAKTIPIIAMTANAFSEDISNSLNAGMDAHIAKPMDMDHFEAVYKEILNRKVK